MYSLGILSIIFALLALGTPAMANDHCGLAFKFPGNDSSPHGRSNESPKKLTSMTACFWLSTPAEYAKTFSPSIISYAANSGLTFANDLLVYVYHGNLKCVIGGYHFSTKVRIADDMFHHVCVTWESSSGDLLVYKDGSLAQTLHNVRKGKEIPSGGIWVIGQDQDKFGGDFHRNDSFKGFLTEVHVWNKVLSSRTIAGFPNYCGSHIQGNYKTYSDFKMSEEAVLARPTCTP